MPSETLFFVFLALVLAAVIAGHVYARKKTQRRRDALALLGADIGFRFVAARARDHDDAWCAS